MYCCLRNDVRIESITEVDWIDIVTALKTFCQRINNQRLRIEHKTWRKAQMGRAIEDGSPLQIAIHDGEKDLKEKIHGIDKYREEVQPCFTGHHHYLFGASSCLEGLRADCSGDCGIWEEKTEGSILVELWNFPCWTLKVFSVRCPDFKKVKKIVLCWCTDSDDVACTCRHLPRRFSTPSADHKKANCFRCPTTYS